MLEIFNHEQGTAEWFSVRCGVITASCFGQVLAKGQGKTRRSYMLKLAGERITGNSSDSYSNEHMERGHEQEDTARNLYTEQTGAKIIQVGFIKNDFLGYSPDGLIDDDGAIEIKSKLAHLQAEYLLADDLPPEHKAQVQGGLLVSGRKYLDFVSYCPGMPMFVKRVTRDEEYISGLMLELNRFQAELNAVVQELMTKF